MLLLQLEHTMNVLDSASTLTKLNVLIFTKFCKKFKTSKLPINFFHWIYTYMYDAIMQ